MRRTAVLGLAMVGIAGCAPTFESVPGTPARVIFFTPWSANLDIPAQAIVADAARAAQAAPGRPVLVEGYASPLGSPQENLTLSKLRAQHVADGLVQAGVARDRLVLRPRGATSGNQDVESRRVVIEIGS